MSLAAAARIVVERHHLFEAGDVVGEVLVLGHQGGDARLVLGDRLV